MTTTHFFLGIQVPLKAVHRCLSFLIICHSFSVLFWFCLCDKSLLSLRHFKKLKLRFGGIFSPTLDTLMSHVSVCILIPVSPPSKQHFIFFLCSDFKWMRKVIARFPWWFTTGIIYSFFKGFPSVHLILK